MLGDSAARPARVRYTFPICPPPPESTCIIDGRPYAPSKQAARNVGLCSDYVTRMCREGSVEGRLVANRWYVSEESLRAFLRTVSERKAIWHRSLSDELKGDYQRSRSPPSTTICHEMPALRTVNVRHANTDPRAHHQFRRPVLRRHSPLRPCPKLALFVTRLSPSAPMIVARRAYNQ